MKKNYLIILIFMIQGVSAQLVNIPDAHLKSKILSSSPSNTVAKNLSGNYFAVDANGDGEIQQSEASQVKSLNVSASSIASLTGITAFDKLESLDCSQNNLDSAYVNALASLKWLNASANPLNMGINTGADIEYLDLHNSSIPQDLNLSNKNKLSYLNLQNCSALYNLDCSNSKLSTLILNGCSNLHVLNCSNNQLTTLDLSNLNITGEAFYAANTYTFRGGVDCSHNNLTSLTVSNLTTNFLNCSYNNLTTINAASLTLSKITNAPAGLILQPSLYFDCSHNQLSSLSINNTLIVQSFDCSYNNLTSMNINKIVAQDFNCSHNNISAVNISDTSQIDNLNISYNVLTSFVSPVMPFVDDQDLNPVGNAPSQSIYCNDNLLTLLNLNKTQVLKVYAYNNDIHTLLIKNGILNEFLDLQNNPNITFICADDFPLDPSDPYSEVDYFQSAVPGATISSNCSNSVLSVSDRGIAENNVAIYPNPAFDTVYITSTYDVKSIEISDLQGRLVKTAQNKIHSATLKTSVNDLVAGTYVVKIDTGKGIFVKKLIKK
ncbi:T9SS type A sorting domain-containing protein [uncultured Chryseobacterium sp.]|uniref:T9SS type A sorting domain-containing protein n=1 Tax=uncultured Chryseobacterium sp. TaxID=259322 RepID=UPI0025E235EA|nr:T9SS type A sorting domain-containing protein [uncultured Chryseobacterium sp.]